MQFLVRKGGCLIAFAVFMLLFLSLFPKASIANGIPNSWRYDNGKLLTSQQGELTALSGDDVSLFSKVTNGSGYSVFNWFDRFDSGYCSGKDAAKVIDVSQWQGDINWTSVRNAGVDAAIIRCGYGDNLVEQDDKKWSRNVRGAQSVNMPFGVYIYSYAKNATAAVNEAEHVLRCLREQGLTPSKVSMPIYFDMEDASIGKNYGEIASAFCVKIKSAGYKVGVYANKSWWEGKLTSPVFSNYYKWVAQWNASVGLDSKLFSSFPSSMSVWQFSDYGSVSGISGAVDLNYTYMPEAYGRTAGPGSKVVENGTYEIVAYGNGKTHGLDIAAGSSKSGANAQLYTRNGTKAQRFKLTWDYNGFYKITCVGSGKVLDVAGASAKNGANIQQWSNNGTDAQRWRIDKLPNGRYVLTSKCNNKAMTIAGSRYSNSTNIQCENKVDNTAQQFCLKKLDVPKSEHGVEDGVYVIEPSRSSSGEFAVDVAACNKANGTNVQLWRSNGTDAQKFRFYYDSDGYYRITNIGTNRVLDVAGGRTKNGTNIQIYGSNYGDGQKWRVESNEDGTYTIISKCNNSALSLKDGLLSNKANIHCWDYEGAKSQQWRLVKVS